MSSRIDLKTSLQSNVDLSRYTTMHAVSTAAFFSEPTTVEELKELLDFCQQEKMPFMILGKGSNVIFSKPQYSGLVISTLKLLKDDISFDEKTYQVRVTGAVPLYRFCLLCKDKGFAGAEFLASIPGSIGGAAFMNAGFSRIRGKKNEISDLIQEIEIFKIRENKVVTLKRSEIAYSYRKSGLSDCVVLSAVLQLAKGSPEAIDQEIKANFDYRAKEQDVKYPSSGSIFKNPVSGEFTAGQIIDRLGLKGLRVGDAMVSTVHGNYMVNVGRATGKDFIELIQKIQKAVLDETGVSLQPEVVLA